MISHMFSLVRESTAQASVPAVNLQVIQDFIDQSLRLNPLRTYGNAIEGAFVIAVLRPVVETIAAEDVAAKKSQWVLEDVRADCAEQSLGNARWVNVFGPLLWRVGVFDHLLIGNLASG